MAKAHRERSGEISQPVGYSVVVGSSFRATELMQ
jgi:hypothetical protein